MKKILFVAMTLAVLTAPVYADYDETRKLELDAQNIQALVIDCGAGFLEITGVEGLTSIEVDAEIVIENMSEKKALDFIEECLNLDLTSRGKGAKLVSTFEEKGFFSSIFRSEGSRAINLTVRVPKEMELKIDDGSGYIEIRDIDDNITIDDGSGDIVCEQINGSMRIDDGSGEIELQVIIGDVDIDDGSGEVTISGVTGDVEVDDGSGDIDIRRIEGFVIVDDGSGDIKIDRVGEDVKIISEGSGHCSITNVDGHIDR